MTSTVVGNLKAVFSVDSVALKTGFKEAEKATSGFAAALGAIGLGALTSKFLNVSDSLAEFRGDIKRTFGQGAPQIEAFVKDAVTSLGIAESELSKVAIRFGGVFSSFGLTDSQSADLAKNFSTIAANISASFADISIEDASAKLQAGLRGSEKALQQFGISVSEETIAAEAFSMGLGRNVAALTDQQKALATASAIQKQANKFTGEAIADLNTYEGATKKLGAVTEQLAGQFGDVLKPAAIAVANSISDLVRALSTMPDIMKIVVATAIAGGAAFLALNSALAAVGISITTVAALAAAFTVAYQAVGRFYALLTDSDFIGPIDAIAAAVKDIADGATSGFTVFMNLIGGLLTGIVDFIEAITGIQGLGDKMRKTFGDIAEGLGDADFRKKQDELKGAVEGSAAAVQDFGMELNITAEDMQKYRDNVAKAVAANKELDDALSSISESAVRSRAELTDGAGAGDLEAAYQRAAKELQGLYDKQAKAGKTGIAEGQIQNIGLTLELELKKILMSSAGAENFPKLLANAALILEAFSQKTLDASEAVDADAAVKFAKRLEEAEKIVDAAEQKKEQAANELAEAAERNASIFEAAAQRSRDAFDEFVGALSNAASSIGGTVASVLSQSGDGPISLQAGAVGSAAGGAAGAAAGLAIGLPPQVGGQVGSALGGIVGSAAEASGALSEVSAAVSRSINAIQKGVGSILGALAPVIQMAAVNFSSVIGVISDVLVAVSPVFTALVGVLKPFMSIITSLIMPIFKSLAPLIASVVAVMEPLTPVLIALFAPILGLVLVLEEFKVITTALNFVAKGLASGLAFLSAAFQFASFGINKAMEFLIRGIGEFVKSIPGLEDIGKSIVKQADGFGRSADDAWDAAMESVRRGGELAGEAIGIYAPDAGGNGKARIKAAQERARKERRDALREELKEDQRNKINDHLSESGTSAANALDKLSESVGNATQDFKAEAFRFGAADALNGASPPGARNPALFGAQQIATPAGIFIDTVNVTAGNMEEFQRSIERANKRSNFVRTGTTEKGGKYFGRGESQ